MILPQLMSHQISFPFDDKDQMSWILGVYSSVENYYYGVYQVVLPQTSRRLWLRNISRNIQNTAPSIVQL